MISSTDSVGAPTPWLGLTLSGIALILWSLSPFCFAAMGRRIGPLATNLLRLALACLILIVIMIIRPFVGSPFLWPQLPAWLWLSASGVVGLAIGDFFLYRALATEGPEKTSQIQTLAPAATAVMAWVFLREYLTFPQLGGMALILSGVSLATWEAAKKKRLASSGPGTNTFKSTSPASQSEGPKSGAAQGTKPSSYLMNGVWAGVWSSLFQGLGTVLARQAFISQVNLDPVLATTIRIASGTVVIWIFARFQGPLGPLLTGSRERKMVKLLLAGTLFGPLLGMICYVSALKYAPAGVVTTITFMNPLIIIPLGAWYYGTRVGISAITGTCLSLAGVILLGFG